ncbi:MAG: glycoside hydrolase family 99-like domain-containing protein [Christensenellales bacterium]
MTFIYMKKILLNIISIFSFSAAVFAAQGYDVAAFVWPAYQPEPRWSELGIFKHGKGEWQSIYEAKPKFKGHKQPKVPLWGYENEADPIVVARKIDAALAAGVNVFIYDWYWYENKPFLQNGIDNGFLKAPNNERMKFYIMWANHNVDDLWDNTKPVKPTKLPHLNAKVNLEQFKNIANQWVEKYFKRPNYYKIDGKPVFMIYLPNSFVNQIGGVKEAHKALDYLREIVKKAGFPGVHLQAQFEQWWAMNPFKLKGNDKDYTLKELINEFGYDSALCYNWLCIESFGGSYYKDERKDMDYTEWGEKAMAKFPELKKLCGVPFIPNVTCGWDTNPRFPQNAYRVIATGQSPKAFEMFLRKAQSWCDTQLPAGMPKIITINSWNEWSEGSYLEPDAEFGYGYLNALARVFGPNGQATE